MAGIDLEDVRRDYEAGMSLRALALKYNCSKSVVNKWAKRDNWKRGRVDKKPEDEHRVSTAPEDRPDYERIRALAVKLLDRVEDALDDPENTQAKALRAIGATLLDVRQLLNAVSPIEAEEQRLRIMQLQRDSTGEAGQEVKVCFVDTEGAEE